jgi:hypothetical protein
MVQVAFCNGIADGWVAKKSVHAATPAPQHHANLKQAEQHTYVQTHAPLIFRSLVALLCAKKQLQPAPKNDGQICLIGRPEPYTMKDVWLCLHS